jgi:hypothetical protein
MKTLFREKAQVVEKLGTFSHVFIALAFCFFMGQLMGGLANLHRRVDASRLERLSRVALVLAWKSHENTQQQWSC